MTTNIPADAIIHKLQLVNYGFISSLQTKVLVSSRSVMKNYKYILGSSKNHVYQYLI